MQSDLRNASGKNRGRLSQADLNSLIELMKKLSYDASVVQVKETNEEDIVCISGVKGDELREWVEIERSPVVQKAMQAYALDEVERILSANATQTAIEGTLDLDFEVPHIPHTSSFTLVAIADHFEAFESTAERLHDPKLSLLLRRAKKKTVMHRRKERRNQTVMQDFFKSTSSSDLHQ